jgi:dTDP-4-amino-4,6-dideoxygalactose transaminase
VGLLAWQSGAEVVFADIDKALIQRLRSAGAYRVNLYGNRRSASVEVTGAAYLDASERERIARELVSLPMFPELNQEQIGYVVAGIKEFVKAGN